MHVLSDLSITNLQLLFLGDNELTSLPPEIVEQGKQAILAYLHEQLESSQASKAA